MASTSTTATDVAGTFKRIYGDEFHKIRKPEALLQEEFPFEANDSGGESYREAIRMTEEHGFTLRAATTTTSSAGLNDPISLTIDQLIADNSVTDFVSRIDIDVVQKAMGGGKRAFIDGVGIRVEGMRDAMSRHEEWKLLYGGTPLGAVTTTNVSSTSTTMLFSVGTWSPGWWYGTKNMPLDISSDALGVTLVNSNAKLQVSNWDLNARTVTVTGNATDITAIDTAFSVTAGYIWRRGGKTSTESPGLVTLSATTAGTVHGLSQTTYPGWKAVQHSVGGQLTMAHLLQADAKLGAQGGLSKKAKRLYTSFASFAVLNSDLAANRRYDGSYSKKKGVNGFAALEYNSPTGSIEIMVHPYMQNGNAILFDPTSITRRGVSDITFEYLGKEMFSLVPGYQQYEYRGYANQGLFNNGLHRSAYLTGITVPA